MNEQEEHEVIGHVKVGLLGKTFLDAYLETREAFCEVVGGIGTRNDQEQKNKRRSIEAAFQAGAYSLLQIISVGPQDNTEEEIMQKRREFSELHQFFEQEQRKAMSRSFDKLLDALVEKMGLPPEALAELRTDLKEASRDAAHPTN